ncbi:MAG: oligoendopeptidase F [Mycoplasmatales bacterium]|nr:oligoendopeptidase F [Mycoplasmatales bacterium]
MHAKQFKKRSDIPEKYKWDLDDILKGKKISDLINEFQKLSEKSIEEKDSKYESKEKLLKALKREDKIDSLGQRIFNYITNNVNSNMIDPEMNKLYKEVEFIEYKINKEIGPELPRIFKHEKNIKKWIELEEFKNYKRTFVEILETKKHQLPKKIQEFRSIQNRADTSLDEIFDLITNAELNFGYATNSKGKKIKITRANLSSLRENSDFNVRKSAMQNYIKAYLNHKDSLSNILFQHMKKATVWAKLKNHNSVIDYLVFNDRGSEKLLLSLYASVQKNMDVFKSYDKLHKKIYKAKFNKSMTKYDYSVPLVKVKGKYTVEEMQEMVYKSVLPFGKEYSDKVKMAFDERWVDYMSVDNKRSGAYSIAGSKSIDKKYILMNNDGTIRSAETLAHEMGHSMHTYYSDKLHIRDAGYKIFVAEIASIFNELMFFDYMLNNTNDDKLKFKIRKQMAEGFEGTVLRQIQFSNYEYDVYKAIEEGKPVSTYEALSKIYYENSKKYSLRAIKKYKENEQVASITIPHYYYGFYVYKYAIGQLVANIFFAKYKKEGKQALQDYIKNFLSVGNTKRPIETLKDAGINLENPEEYNIGFENARENIIELKKLAKKLFKIK